MNNIRSCLHAALIPTLALVAETALAQQPPSATIVRTVLAVTSLPSVIDGPVFFKLSKIELPVGQTTKYLGPVGFLYVLSGALAAQSDAGHRSLQQDDAFLVTAGNAHTLSASGSQAAQFLHFVLARSNELGQSSEQPPAVVTELYRTSRAIPDVKSGRYEFNADTRQLSADGSQPSALALGRGALLAAVGIGNLHCGREDRDQANRHAALRAAWMGTPVGQ